jgi:hypothetical protein
VDTVELLLRAGASVDAVGMYSWTPLLVSQQFCKCQRREIEREYGGSFLF